jgi:hypothetical protein
LFAIFLVYSFIKQYLGSYGKKKVTEGVNLSYRANKKTNINKKNEVYDKYKNMPIDIIKSPETYLKEPK